MRTTKLSGHIAWACECSYMLLVIAEGVVACQNPKCPHYKVEYQEPVITAELKPL